MSKPKLIVYMEESILSSIKKEAFSEGKSTSEIAAKWLRAHYENPSRFEDVPGPDQVEAFKKAIREMRNGGEDEEDYRTVLADMGLESLKTTPGPDGLSPSIVRYLLETQARIDFLLQKVLGFADMPGVTPGEREDWIGVAGRNAQEVLKNLNLGGENERQHG
jgi:hypothetical protein